MSLKKNNNHYVGPGDGWTFLGSSDPFADSLDDPPSSPFSVVLDQLQVPSSFNVMDTQDPFDFINLMLPSPVMNVPSPLFLLFNI